jgi:Fascin domain
VTYSEAVASIDWACLRFVNCSGPKGLFAIEWQPDGAAALKAGANGRYLTARMNGSLYAVSDEVGDRERFTLTLVNRPRLVLRCDHGLVGVKTAGGGGSNGPARYECNRALHDPIKLIAAAASSSSSTENGAQSGVAPVAVYYLLGTCTSVLQCESVTTACFSDNVL